MASRRVLKDRRETGRQGRFHWPAHESSGDAQRKTLGCLRRCVAHTRAPGARLLTGSTRPCLARSIPPSSSSIRRATGIANNEAPHLREVLASIGQRDNSVEFIVVDGGSADDSCAVAARAGARVVDSPVCQRAAQMNLGARETHGSILLFLHADTRLPTGWRESLCDAFRAAPDCVGGAFRRRFDSGSRLLRITCRLADWRGRRFGWFLGDQAMFVRRDVFERLHGYAPLHLFEDLELSVRLARTGSTRLLDAVVISSGRRFAPRGAALQTLSDLALTVRFLISPQNFVDEARGETFETNSTAELACAPATPVHRLLLGRRAE